MAEKAAISLNIDGVEREELEVDVLLVGAGPASLACAVSLSRLLKEKGRADASILVLEKAEDIGYHTLSGAVMDPRGMAELFPDWREAGCPVEADVNFDCVDYLKSGGGKFRLKGPLVPPPLHNKGNVIVSLYRVVRWMKDKAEELEVEVYPGFAGAEVRYDESGSRVIGVQTRDAGIGKSGEQKGTFEPGMNVTRQGHRLCRGHAWASGQGLDPKAQARCPGANHQVYETGIKEIWEHPRGARQGDARSGDPHHGRAARHVGLRRWLDLRNL